MRRSACVVAGLALAALAVPAARAAEVLCAPDAGVACRWDAAPFVAYPYGERSLDGGLRYSLQGGSWQAFRDLFHWTVVPSVADFEDAIETAFAAWTVVDPATGLGTSIAFVADLATPVFVTPPDVPVSAFGAEIDLLASPDGVAWDPGSPLLRAETNLAAPYLDGVTLTSGVEGYPSARILGVDIRFNDDPEAHWTLDWFRLLLTHEIGHALGLGDVDRPDLPDTFLDDDYDPQRPLATLTDSWARLVDPLDPDASPALSFHAVADGAPGFDTPGVDILMESNLPRPLLGDPTPLRNDDFGGRQFLYPSLAPEPGAAAAALAAFAALVLARRAGRVG